MFSNMASSDIIISAMAIIGLMQAVWLSVMLLRRGFAPQTIQQVLLPMLAIWILFWPVYIDKRWLWVPLIILALTCILAYALRTIFWQQLTIAWQPERADKIQSDQQQAMLPPLLPLQFALAIAGLWFQYIPEFGFGLALCLCIAFPIADAVDRFGGTQLGFVHLGFPAHPLQTLGGHLLLISLATVILCWALHVYHGTAWQSLFIATLITGLVASGTRAIIPGQWNLPASMVSMGLVMWML